MFLEFLYTLFSKIVFFTGAVMGRNSFPKPLGKEEEEKYLRLARAGDKGAKDVLVRHNMRLVAHIVKKYAGAAETENPLNGLSPAEHIRHYMEQGLDKKEALKRAAKDRGVSKSELYKYTVEEKL